MFLEEYSWFHAAPLKGSRTPLSGPWEAAMVREVRWVAYGVVAPLILSVGILGNLLVIVLLRLPQFKGVVFSFFTVLAVADLLSLALCISPLHHILAGATVHHATAVWYSYFELLLLGVAMSTSVLIVVCITVYRFFSVCRPGKFQRLNNPRFAWVSMAAAFGTAVVAWLPMSFLRQPRIAEECQAPSFTPPDNRTWWVACLIHDASGKGYFIAYVWIRQTLVTFLPILAVVTLNVCTLRGFLRHREMRRRLLNQNTSEQAPPVSKSREEKYLMGLLIAVILSFVITIVPSGIANAINTGSNTSKVEFVIFSAVANNLEILNHSLNFYLYILCSKTVRDTLLEYYNKHRSNVTRKFDGFFSREVKSRTSGVRKEGRKKDSESPLSELQTGKDTQQIYAISRTSLPSEPFPAVTQGTDSIVWREGNRQNEALQDYRFPHVIRSLYGTPASSTGHENPNFEFTL